VDALPGIGFAGIFLGQSQTFLVLLLMVLAMTFLSDRFLTEANAWNILRQISVNVCLSIGMTLVILSGGIDLSVGSILALSGAVTAGLLIGPLPIEWLNVQLEFSLHGALLAGLFVGMALGGFMYLTGDSDRPPLRVSIPHFHLHGAAAGAAGAMIAHTHRAITGEGQHVDVSCQQAVAKTLAHAPQSWDLEGVILKRMGVFRQTSGDSIIRTCWPCKDGYINYVLQGGSSGVAASTRTLLAWMDEEDMGDEFLNDVNWEELGYGQVRSEIMEKGVAPLIRFFATHTRQELVAASVERRILLFPVATQQDILDHPQLKARDYFQQLHHPELDTTVNYPGLFVKDRHGERMSLRRRPPLIGEHNREIYQDELGLTLEQVTTLKESGAI